MRYSVRAACCLTIGLTVTGSLWAADIILPGAVVPELGQTDKGSKRIEELEKAIERFKQRDYEKALDLLKATAKKHSDLPPALLMLARLFLASNQLAQGRAALEQALVEHPAYPGVYVSFGGLAVAEGRWADAALHFEKAVTLARPGKWADSQQRFFLVQSHAGLAAVAEARKDWSAAQASLADLLKLEPKNGKARQRLARALFHADKPSEAAQELERAVKDDPTLEPAGTVMGWLYAQKGNHAKAAEWLEQALKRNPKDSRVQLSMARWLLHQGKAEQAKEFAVAAGKLDPKSRDTKTVRGLIARYLKNYPEAESLFQELHQEVPGDATASNQLALVLAEQADQAKRARALQLAEMNVKLYPNSAESLSTLGWVYYRLGRLEEAERALQAAVAGGTTNAETAYYLAHVLSDRGRTEDARQLLEKALKVPGSFVFRKETQDWLDRLTRKAP
jgi:tetratricopeptide (TPR) repeat protein